MASNVKIPDFPAISTYKWSCKDTSKRFPVENPATDEVITTVQAGDAETTVNAIEAAQKAFDTEWRWRSPSERGAILPKAANALNEHKEDPVHGEWQAIPRCLDVRLHASGEVVSVFWFSD